MGKVIAWIEDDTPKIQRLVELIELEGHRVVAYPSVKAVLDNLAEIREADLILLDILLPMGYQVDEVAHYAGVELLRKLRLEYGIDTPVIVLTVVGRNSVHNELEGLGVHDIITKPVKPSELAAKVFDALGI